MDKYSPGPLADIQAAHTRLIKAYMVLLNYVSLRGTHPVLKVLVESHIRGKLIELSKAYAIRSHRLIDDDPGMEWLRRTAADCESLAGKLTSVRQFLALTVKLLAAVGLFLLSLLLISAYGKPVSLQEVAVNLEPLLNTLQSTLPMIALVGLGATYVIFFILSFVFSDQYAKKRTFFGDPGDKLSGITRVSLDGETTSVYHLENLLFKLLERDKLPEFPILPIFMLSFFVITYLPFVYLSVYFEVGVTVIIIFTTVMIFSLLYFFYTWLRKSEYQ